jgi:predicted negative regulator of RcsB-dependent stress response
MNSKTTNSEIANQDNLIEKEASLEELSQRLKILEKDIDPDLGQLLAQNWQRVVSSLALALVLVWMWGSYQATTKQRLHIASDRFQNIQRKFSALYGKEASTTESSKLAEDTKSFVQESNLLASSEKGSTYAQLSELYSAVSLSKQNNEKEASQILSKFLEANKSNEGKVELVKELAMLLEVRRKINQQTPDLKAIRAELVKILDNSTVIPVEALVILNRLADSNEARTLAKKKAEELIIKRPELSKQIEEAMRGKQL